MGVSLHGLWVDVNAALPFGTFTDAIRLTNTELQVSNVIVTDTGIRVPSGFKSLSANGFGFNALDCSITGNNGATGDGYNNAGLTVIGWSGGVQMINSQGFINNLQTCGVNQSGVGLINSSLSTSNIQIFGCSAVFSQGGYGLQLSNSSVQNLYLGLFSNVFGTCALIDCNSYYNNFTPAVVIDHSVKGVSGSDFTYTAGVFVGTGSSFQIEQGLTIQVSNPLGSPIVTSPFNQPVTSAYIQYNSETQYSELVGIPPFQTIGLQVNRGGTFVADCTVVFQFNDVNLVNNAGGTINIKTIVT